MYVVFEGIDGTGKSTQIELVKERLNLVFEKVYEVDINIITISEPELDEVIDENDEIELALRFALQRQILLKPLFGEYYSPLSDTSPVIVLSDRSYYSSLAYQSNYLSSNFIRNINEFVPEPTLVFFFDNGVPDDYELRRVRNCYLKQLPLSAIRVDTENHTIAQTTEYIVENILSYWRDFF